MDCPSQHAKLPYPNVAAGTQAGSIANARGTVGTQFHEQADLFRNPQPVAEIRQLEQGSALQIFIQFDPDPPNV